MRFCFSPARSMLPVCQPPSESEGLRLWEKSLGVAGGAPGGRLGGAALARPRTSLSLQEKLERMILGSEAAQQHPEEVRGLWQTCGELMFSLELGLRHLGLGKEVRPQPRWGVEGIDEGHVAWREGHPMGRQQAVHHA